MEISSIQQIYEAFTSCTGVCTDSRKIEPGCLFVALKGPSFNANAFTEQALENGAKWILIDEAKYFKEGKTLLVKDTLTALQELAKMHRKHFNIPVIGITGSNGKTTTKDLIYSVFSRKMQVVATQGNYNNHIGVPLTLLRINTTTDIVIVEMGANHVGEIGFLSRLAEPGFGLITNIGKAHLGEFGGIEQVIQAKKELYDHIKENKGKVFVNADDPLLSDLAKGLEQVTYGKGARVDCQGALMSANPFLTVEAVGLTISTQLVGEYNFENILAAICIGQYFNVPAADIQKAIEQYVPDNNRSQVVETGKGNQLILDAYNANPSSMQVAIKNFSLMQAKSKVLVLGDMKELGKYEIEEHSAVLEQADQLGIKNVFLVGPVFAKAGERRKFNVLQPKYFSSVKDLEEAIRTGKVHLKNNAILLKGSRSMQLEKLQEVL